MRYASAHHVQVLEGRAYRLANPWVGVAKRFQTDINRNTDIVAARRKERDYFQNYRYMAERMGSEYLAKLLSKVLLIANMSVLALLILCSEHETPKDRTASIFEFQYS